MTDIAPRLDRPVVLTGPMGAGKTALAPLVAARLGVGSVETDALVVERDGRSIEDIFSEEGEAAFRRLELAALGGALEGAPAVVDAGGGALCSEAAWQEVHAAAAVTVRLDAPAQVLARRTAGGGRPLLDGTADASAREARLARLTAERSSWYERADLQWDTSSGGLEQLADELATAILEHVAGCIPVRLGPQTYEVCAQLGGIADVAVRCSRRRPPQGAAARVAVVTDARAGGHWAGPVEAALRDHGYSVTRCEVPEGERAKSLPELGRLIDALLEAGLQRGSLVVAVGGGCIGDVAGLAASLLHRGCPVAQVPTTLLAMVDAAIGGKTAVNHALGKNLIGTFHQPLLVHIALETLETLEEREYRAGLGEVVKYGLLEGEALLARLEAEAEALARRDLAALLPIVRECAGIKARVVAQDAGERGLRRILNLGHTVGHALEARGGYRRWLHGEAVAMGLVAACRVASARGRAGPALERRVAELLERLGLPADPYPHLGEETLAHLALDKKVSGETVRFVVPTGHGVEVDSVTVSELKGILT